MPSNIASTGTPLRQPEAPSFKLECVVVCAGCSDFLRETLPTNRSLFDRIVVVTSDWDKSTQRLCAFYRVEVVIVKGISKSGDFHNKGRAINQGLDRLDMDGWVLVLSESLWLLPSLREHIDQAALDKSFLFGIDQVHVPSFTAWRDTLEGPKRCHDCEGWFCPKGLHNEPRTETVNGYIVPGSFQLWHPITSGIYHYVQGHSAGGREDGNFAQLWPKTRRKALEEIAAYRLHSGPPGIPELLWPGRRASYFGHVPPKFGLFSKAGAKVRGVFQSKSRRKSRKGIS